MITCPHCGTMNPDHYTQCPNCGSPLVQAQAQPQPAPQPSAYIPPAAQPVNEITSLGSWFGWYLLLCILPVIGTIIMLCSVKDPSAKNFAKLMLILQAVVIAIYVLLFALGIAAGISGARSLNF